jgi:hypothetical protein
MKTSPRNPFKIIWPRLLIGLFAINLAVVRALAAPRGWLVGLGARWLSRRDESLALLLSAIGVLLVALPISLVLRLAVWTGHGLHDAIEQSHGE